LWPSLLRGSSVVRDFRVENFSSQKPRTREGILYMIAWLPRPILERAVSLMQDAHPSELAAAAQLRVLFLRVLMANQTTSGHPATSLQTVAK
jgi:hypothetical protein